MTLALSRRSCLLTVPAAALAASRLPAAPAERAPQAGHAPRPGELGGTFPAQDPVLVSEMVGASHGRIDRVRELLILSPELAKAAHDGGFGDWESALGAASHVGNREIAALLMAHGARPDLFTFAMLGHLDVVQALIAAQPDLAGLRGPHGLTLMHHARQGGDHAREVVAFLATLPDADRPDADAPLDPGLREAIVGLYAAPALGDRRIAITFEERPKRFGVRVGTRPMNLLVHEGAGVFHAGGAPTTTVRFRIEDGLARSLTIGGLAPVEANRVDAEQPT